MPLFEKHLVLLMQLYWSKIIQIAFMPLQVLSPLTSASQLGRTYNLDAADYDAVCKLV